MRRVILSGTGLEVSRFGFGTGSLHHLRTSLQRHALLGTALECGITHFDTARMYGHGMGEREVGRMFGAMDGRVTIATKLGFPACRAFEAFPPLMYVQKGLKRILRTTTDRWTQPRLDRFAPHQLEVDLQRSLRALRRDHIDILFLHEPRVVEADAIARAIEWLLRCKHVGRVRYLGLSGSAPDCVALATRFASVFDVLQVEDSLDRDRAVLLRSHDRPVQSSFGYFRSINPADSAKTLDATLALALARNPHGMILFSSRNTQRIQQLVAMAEALDDS
jgi:D-threo-aldose 1-dehydrogenase